MQGLLVSYPQPKGAYCVSLFWFVYVKPQPLSKILNALACKIIDILGAQLKVDQVDNIHPVCIPKKLRFYTSKT